MYKCLFSVSSSQSAGGGAHDGTAGSSAGKEEQQHPVKCHNIRCEPWTNVSDQYLLLQSV